MRILRETIEAKVLISIVIEDVDSSTANPARDSAIFSLIENALPEAPVLLTGREAPQVWPSVLPDLISRFSAMLSFPLWAPDDALLAALARKLREVLDGKNP